jgi:hypothetical protein
MAHMRALNALSSLPDHKIWIRSLRYVLVSFPRSACLNSGHINRILRYFWRNFQFMT